VALAIAVFLAAVLTRFVFGTRMNAFKVHEQVAMEVLSESLIESATTREPQLRRTDGRSGALRWRMEFLPIPVYMRATALTEKKPAQGDARQSNAAGLAQAPSGSTQRAVPTQAEHTMKWKVFHLAAAITSPSGQNHAIETIRLLHDIPEPQPAQTEQR